MKSIIELAREAAGGMLSYDAEDNWKLSQAEAERFAELVAREVRKDAALNKMADNARELGLDYVQPAHCEAGPEYCPQCLKESKPTYGSEEVRKLREVIESQAKIIALMEKEQGCPPFWPVVQRLLDEYGLQLIDVVAAYKQATEQPAPAQPWVGLTEEERHSCTQSPFVADNYRAIEAKLKEKNT